MMIAQDRRTMTYKDGEYYVDIVNRGKRYEAWIYKETPNQISPKFFIKSAYYKIQSYFDFYESICNNLDDYKWMCDADVSYENRGEEPTDRDWDDYCEFQLTRMELAHQVAWNEVTEGVRP